MATARRPHWVLQGCCIAVVVAHASAVQCDLTGQCEFQALLIGTPQGVSLEIGHFVHNTRTVCLGSLVVPAPGCWSVVMCEPLALMEENTHDGRMVGYRRAEVVDEGTGSIVAPTMHVDRVCAA